jgi:hypothetical protein
MYLFIYCLFNNNVDNELERIWREAVMAKVKVLALPGGTEENHEK